MNADRVIFFSKDDLACGDMLSLAQPILDTFDSNKDYDHILDIIELYHIKQYIDADMRLTLWGDELFLFYQNTTKQMWSVVNRYFASITNENLEDHLRYINDEKIEYSESFWQLLDKCKTYKLINPETFSKLFDITIWKEDILSCKNIVIHFSTQLRELLLKYDGSAELIISHYEKTGSDKRSGMIIPQSLSIEDKEMIINGYIDSDSPNPNYLEVITMAKDQSNFKLSSQTKLKAKRRYDEIIAELFKKNTTATCFLRYGVSFSETQTKPIDVSREDNKLFYTYSIPYIQSNLSPIAIFKNFQHLFGFVDKQSRIALVRKLQDINFLDIVGLHQQNKYLCPETFNMRNELATIQLLAYKHILQNYFDICLEDTIGEIFNAICSTCQIENLRIQFDTSTSFVGVAPINDPKYLTLVVLDTPSRETGLYISGGIMAAPTVRDIFTDVLPYLGVEPDYSDEDIRAVNVAVPDLSEMTLSEAESVLRDRSLRCRTVGDGTVVTGQIPVPGAEIPGDAQVILYLGAEVPQDEVTVPDFRGMGVGPANTTASDYGLYLQAKGSDRGSVNYIYVTHQSIEPGTTVPRGTTITVEFTDNRVQD